jgi:hypothetical protein
MFGLLPKRVTLHITHTHHVCAKTDQPFMAAIHGHYDAGVKLRALAWYRPGIRGHGALATAKHFLLPNAQLVRRWARESEERGSSLERKPGSGRKRKLTDEESTTHVKDFIVKKNKAGLSTSYEQVKQEVEAKTGKEISLRTVQRLGRVDHNMTEKLTTRKLAIEGSITFPLLRCSGHPHLELDLCTG